MKKKKTKKGQLENIKVLLTQLIPDEEIQKMIENKMDVDEIIRKSYKVKVRRSATMSKHRS